MTAGGDCVPYKYAVPAYPLYLYPFKYRDQLTRKWRNARYKAELRHPSAIRRVRDYRRAYGYPRAIRALVQLGRILILRKENHPVMGEA